MHEHEHTVCADTLVVIRQAVVQKNERHFLPQLLKYKDNWMLNIVEFWTVGLTKQAALTGKIILP